MSQILNSTKFVEKVVEPSKQNLRKYCQMMKNLNKKFLVDTDWQDLYQEAVLAMWEEFNKHKRIKKLSHYTTRAKWVIKTIVRHARATHVPIELFQHDPDSGATYICKS